MSEMEKSVMEMDKGQGFRSQRGSAVTSVAALVGLVGLLYVVYINLQVTGEQATKGMETKAVSQGVACMSNRQAIRLSITTWSVTHPGVEPTLEDLQKDGIHITSCPDGGRFTLEGGKVSCSIHSN